MQPMITLASLLLATTVTACAMQPVYVDRLGLDYPSPMVATRIQQPLYLVLDPDRVPDRVTVREPSMKNIEVFHIRAWVQQILPDALKRFFANVEVVGPDAQLPTTPHMVADVEVRSIGAIVDKAVGNTGVAARVYGTMTWGIAIRRSGEKNYAFSYSASVQGVKPLTHVSETDMMYGSTFSMAIGEMNKRLVEGGLERLVPIE